MDNFCLNHGCIEVASYTLTHDKKWVKFSDDILKYFSFFSQKKRFDISCKLSLMEIITVFTIYIQADRPEQTNEMLQLIRVYTI